MPLLGGLLVNLFGALVAWLSQFVVRKVAFALAGVAFMTGITVALFVSMRTALLALSGMGGLPGVFVQVLAMAVPPAAAQCLSIYVTIWTACTAYSWQRDLIHLAMKA